MSSKSSRKTTEDPTGVLRSDLPERVAVGRVLRPHGVRGELVVEVLSDVPERLAPGSRLIASREGRPTRQLIVETRRPHKSGALVRFAGVEGRDGAEEMRDTLLEVDRSQVPAAPEGTYYWYQLLGCRCWVGGEDLGEVTDLVEDGGGLLLVVSDGERQVPIPFVQSFLKEVDVERGRIELELPEGLLEACASRS
ncbi:MAG TPA: ribosome maturation factor RimM [Thermoanaerobaculia bacterium]|nr:ribosome maturation factor RimM [Thermoanaerobaculia bacterium]